MSLFNFHSGTPNQNQKFYIYELADQNNANPIIVFDSLIEFGYTNQVQIAYEPIEQGSFSSDSLQGSPFNINLVGKVAPTMSDTVQSNTDMRNEINKVIVQLRTYLENTTLLKIINNRPLFDNYPSVKMTSFNYNLTPDINVLKCFMTFQEIRQVASQYVALPQNQVANPTNASVIDNGQQSAKVTTP